jgi:anhydro-N-acetylmuramic acid kinase
MSKKIVLGLMSGTSLDGLDCCAVEFDERETGFAFNIIATKTFGYASELIERLKKSKSLSALELLELNIDLGRVFSDCCNRFITDNDLKIDFIASHGHTVYHQPEKNLTLQIGDGQVIANSVGLPVVCEFRTKDVLLGGQGAPLVPIGDKFLFPDNDICINLGGIANLSYQKNDEIHAFDICSCNLGLNLLASELGLEYDNNGENAAQGIVDKDLLTELNRLPFFKANHPKSLGAEWFEDEFWPLILKSNLGVKNKLATVAEHIAIQISEVTNPLLGQNILMTGGGAFNTHLINRLKSKSNKNIVVPSKQIVAFKEALIFAFLGFLRFNNKVNVLKSVTGAKKDSSSGQFFYP